MKGSMMSENDSNALDELIGQLYESDRYINLDLMSTIMAQGEAIVDRLIEVVENDDDWPGVHALLMLIEMQAEKALPSISKALLEDPDLNEWVDNEGLDKYGPVAIDTLETMVNDKTADWYPRALSASALVRIAARYPETYDRITAILRGLLPDPSGDFEEASTVEDPEVWSSAVSDLAQLRDPQSYELIGRLLDGDWIDERVISRDYYEELYQSTDPLYGEQPEPRGLLASQEAMQKRWKRSEARQTEIVQPVRPSGRNKRKVRRLARKSQRQARRKQRKKGKKKKKR
jgi:hypothetical protein